MPIQLTPGQILTQDQLCELTNTVTPPVNSHAEYARRNLTLVKIYTNLNKTLRSQGLCIESRNYYTEFHVLAGDTAKKKIKQYHNKKEASRYSENQLRKGVRAFNRRRNFPSNT